MNSRIVRSALLVAGLMTLAGLTFSGTPAQARLNREAPPTSPVIATVDLEAIVAGLTERKDKEDALKASLADAQKRVDKMVEDLKSDQSKLEQMPGGVDKDKAVKEFREKAIRADFEQKYAQKLLVEMQGEMLRDLFTKIADATKRYAKKSGYSLVLISDEKAEVPKSEPEAITRAISMRRMLYVDPSLDITQEIITAMNNEYSAARSTPTSSSTPPAPVPAPKKP